MLTLSLAQEIDRLLNEGKLSQRKIAERLGIGRATVGAIASGKRGIYGKVPKPGEPNERGPHAAPQRCSRCGFLVFMPCLVCRTRDYRREQRMLGPAESARNLPTRHARRRPPGRRRQRPCRARVA